MTETDTIATAAAATPATEEATDLAASKPKLVRRLAQELTDSLQACRAQRPVLRSTGQPIAWPAEAAQAM